MGVIKRKITNDPYLEIASHLRAIFVVLAVLAVLYFFFGSMNGITTAGKALQNRAENYVAFWAG